MEVSLQFTRKILPQEHQQPQTLHPPCGSLCPGFFQILSPLEGFPSPLGMVPGSPKDWLGRAAIFPLALFINHGLKSPLCTRIARAWILVSLPWPGTGQLDELRGVFFFQSKHNSFITSPRLLVQFRSSLSEF